MSSILYPPARPQSIGEVLDSAFRIFKVTLVPCLPYGVLATVAGQLQNIYLIVTGRTLHSFTNTDPAWWLLYVSGALLGGTLLNAIFVRQAAIASGLRTTSSAALKEALRKAPATIAAGLLILAIVGACFVPLLLVPRAYWPTGRLVLGLLAAFLGVFFLCSWPALLVGHKGVIRSLRYSAKLVRGNWWRTVLIYAVAVIMIIVVSVTAALIFSVLAAFGATRDLAVATAVSAVTVVASGAVYMPFITAMTLSLYGDLQARREGIDLERRIAGAPAG
jgi:hypothetical protein